MPKTKVIKVRISHDEYIAITAMGKPVGGVSALVRKRLLGQGVSPIKKESIRELARIGVALNLISRQLANRQVIETVELLAILGSYTLTSLVLNTFRVPLPEGAVAPFAGKVIATSGGALGGSRPSAPFRAWPPVKW